MFPSILDTMSGTQSQEGYPLSQLGTVPIKPVPQTHGVLSAGIQDSIFFSETVARVAMVMFSTWVCLEKVGNIASIFNQSQNKQLRVLSCRQRMSTKPLDL